MNRLHEIGCRHSLVKSVAALVILLTGCGTTTPAAGVLSTTPLGTHLHADLAITAPALGGLAVSFHLPAKGYGLQATPADIQKIEVALNTKTLLVTSTVAIREVTRDQIVANKATVSFPDLKAGSYTLVITALDANSEPIGKTTATAPVTAGQTSMVDAVLKIGDGAAPAPAGPAAPVAPVAPAPVAPVAPGAPAPVAPAAPAPTVPVAPVPAHPPAGNG